MMWLMTDLNPRVRGWVPDLSTFGARLALVRQRMGWTNIKEAAEACAIAPQTWRHWESGRFGPRQLVNACIKISGVTGVDYRWLALGPDDRAEAGSAEVTATRRYQPGTRIVTSIPSQGTRPVVRANPLGTAPLAFTASK